MDTPFNHQYPRPQPPYKSSPLPNLQQQHGGSGLAMRFLTLQRVTANRIIVPLNRSQLPTHFSPNAATFKSTMADDAKMKSQSADESSNLSIIRNKQEAENKGEKSPAIPPPPEKPLPGDCCGSGCVRCVWDVYYEELEEYNNLYKNKSDPEINPKPS